MRRASPRGAVTAELAVGLPLLLAVTAALVWLVALGVDQARTVDAARETARALARGDAEPAAVALGRRVAPAGSRVVVRREGAHITVTVTGRMRGPGGLFGRWGAGLEASSVALSEDDDDAAAPVPSGP